MQLWCSGGGLTGSDVRALRGQHVAEGRGVRDSVAAAGGGGRGPADVPLSFSQRLVPAGSLLTSPPCGQGASQGTGKKGFPLGDVPWSAVIKAAIVLMQLLVFYYVFKNIFPLCSFCDKG